MGYLLWIQRITMMSSNGSFFRVTDLCDGNPPVTGGFPSQRPVTRSFGVFFVLCLNKRLSKQLRRWWFETPSRLLWNQCKDALMSRVAITLQCDAVITRSILMKNLLYIGSCSMSSWRHVLWVCPVGFDHGADRICCTPSKCRTDYSVKRLYFPLVGRSGAVCFIASENTWYLVISPYRVIIVSATSYFTFEILFVKWFTLW